MYKKNDKEIIELLDVVDESGNKDELTYKKGVQHALMWVLGHREDPPFDKTDMIDGKER